MFTRLAVNLTAFVPYIRQTPARGKRKVAAAIGVFPEKSI
jgi:hypothetical protein